MQDSQRVRPALVVVDVDLAVGLLPGRGKHGIRHVGGAVEQYAAAIAEHHGGFQRHGGRLGRRPLEPDRGDLDVGAVVVAAAGRLARIGGEHRVSQRARQAIHIFGAAIAGLDPQRRRKLVPHRDRVVLGLAAAVAAIAVRLAPRVVRVHAAATVAGAEAVVGAEQPVGARRVDALESEPVAHLGSLGDVVQHAAELRAVLQRAGAAHQLDALDGLHRHAEVAGRVAVHVRVRDEPVLAVVELPAAVRIEAARRDVDLVAGAVHVVDEDARHL